MAERAPFRTRKFAPPDARLFPNAANFYKQIVFHNCARPFYIYVETFLPAFIQFFALVSIPLFDDLVRERADRIARAGARASGRGFRHRKKPRWQVQDLKTERFNQKGLRFILTITEPLEKAGFAFLLINGADQFYYNWTSLLLTSTFCDQPILSGPLSRSRMGGSISILPGGAGIPMTTLDQNRAGWVNNSFGMTPPAGIINAMAGVTVTGPSGGITGVKVRLSFTSLTGTANIDSDPVDIVEGEESDLVVQTEVFLSSLGARSLTWQLVGPAVPVGLKSKQAFVTVSRSG